MNVLKTYSIALLYKVTSFIKGQSICKIQKLKLKKLSIIIVFLTTININAQEKGFEIGFQLNEYQNDFGIGLQLTSPYIFNENVAVRLRTNMMYFQHIDSKSLEYTWTPYTNISLGVFGHRAMIHENIALYGEGGIVGLLPSSNLTSKDLYIGGYGLFGFEFYFIPEFSYFIEAGGMGVDAVADKLPGKPIYSNGFLTSVGFRITFRHRNE